MSVEVFIRHLLYYSLRHLKQLVACLRFSEEITLFITDQVEERKGDEA